MLRSATVAIIPQQNAEDACVPSRKLHLQHTLSSRHPSYRLQESSVALIKPLTQNIWPSKAMHVGVLVLLVRCCCCSTMTTTNGIPLILPLDALGFFNLSKDYYYYNNYCSFLIQRTNGVNDWTVGRLLLRYSRLPRINNPQFVVSRNENKQPWDCVRDQNDLG